MDLVKKLLELSPILAQLVPGGGVALALATQLASLAEAEISRRQLAKGQTREEVLADAEAEWNKAIQGAEDLRNLGHGGQ